MRSRWLAETAPAVLCGIAEAAWITVFGAAFSAPFGGPGPGGTFLPVLLAVLVGIVAARLVPHRRWRPAVLLSLAVLAVGAALTMGPPLGLVAADGQRPFAAYPLLALALLRGVVEGDPEAGEEAIVGLVRLSPLLLGAGWLLGLVIAEDSRDAFVAEATFATFTFIIAGALALGLSRLVALEAEVRHRPRGDGARLLLIALVVGCTFAVVLPAAVLLGRPVGAIVGGVIATLFTTLGAVAGSIVGLVLFIAGTLVGLIVGLLGIKRPTPNPPSSGEPQVPSLPSGTTPPSDILNVAVAVLVVLAFIAVAGYLVLRWQGRRRGPRPDTGISERRSIVLEPHLRLPLLRMATQRWRGWSPPRSALDAYPRLLADWASLPAVARDPAETPSGHAARLRSSGHGDFGLDLLAADYQLVRFGGVALTPREERRAIDRWRRLHARRPVPDARAGEPVDEMEAFRDPG